ncbi:MAG: sulfite exporter TauE/SafE family protein [Clostridia bacterium]|nr:sulfite exporter TauE/SafE family protein [Clostridia bacterium]MBN2883379.1 sulfite exporter TauE/SafE family protein [Clostridia bacterium]
MNPIILLAMLILFFAAAVQGITGFGRALIATPLIALFMPADETVIIMILMGFISAIVMVLKTFRNAHIKKVLPLIIAGVAGSMVGVYLLKIIPVRELKVVMGIFVIISAIILAAGIRIKFRRIIPAYAIAGFISGLTNGAISFGGPPIVLFLQSQNESKDSFRANLSVFFLIIGLTGSISLLASGMLTIPITLNALLLAPASIGGTFFGNFLSHRFDEGVFKKLVIGILLLSGAMAIIMTLI